MTRYFVRREGWIYVDANSSEEAAQIANEKGESLWEWGDCEAEDDE
jgi:hypothetical protein